MLEKLARGPATVGELAALLPIARPGVSRHLRVLREAGLVEVRQQAQRRVYSLRPEPLAEVDEWLGRYRALWEQRLDAAAHRGGPGETRTKENQMTSNAGADSRVTGSLRSAGGKGVVRMQDRFDTDIDDLWSALTDPSRLARWYGEVEGDLRLGGEFRARLFASGWEGTGRVEACESPRHLLLVTKHVRQADEGVIADSA
jgi:Bacterial regulatory protein, arsR family/Activator of Hsp90 ATPase homolog 1-like protein